MITLPLDPSANANPEALVGFLRENVSMAAREGHPRLISISLAVPALDPLAVLESIFESDQPHFYAERPDLETALAGAEVAVECLASGPDRFATVQRWMDGVLAHAVAVGSVDAPFGGPHFFSAFAFSDGTEPGEPFPAARVFVPQWQVSRAGATTTAVANVLVSSNSSPDLLAERLLRAHARFGRFEFQNSGRSGSRQSAVTAPQKPRRLSEAGDYRTTVRGALERIAKGEFEKIVLARAIDLESEEPLHPLEILNGLRQRFPNCYAFSLANGRGQSFIGASPERLVRISRGVLETEALAGSTRRGSGASEDAALGSSLQRSEKDLREHALVLQAITRRLQGLGLKPDYPDIPELQRLANVQHLRTPIRAELGERVRLLPVIEALHPTPAVGGLPVETALGSIRRLEGFPRGLYAGALGWMNARGGGEFFVGLRSAVVDGNRARIFAGSGIVAGSEPDAEYQETELKFDALRGALAGERP